MKCSVRIDSYFSLPTDLAGAMRDWPEFVSGCEYVVSLRSATEEVATSLEHDEGQPFVFVRGEGEGRLFFHVLGTVLWALSGNSDDVWPRITRWGSDPSAIGESGT